MTLADDFHKQNQFIQNLKDNYSTNDNLTIILSNLKDSRFDSFNDWIIIYQIF